MPRQESFRIERYCPSCINYTDLAVEGREANADISGIEYKERKAKHGRWETVKILTDSAEQRLSKPRGRYSTLSLPRLDLLYPDECEDVSDEISRELCYVCESLSVTPDKILVVCLGNRNLTPDSLGPKSAEYIKPTLHIREISESSFYALECSEISVICPGVPTLTGLDTAQHVRGIAERIMPDLIIAVDALCSKSPKRLGSTIQISDSGIKPGSGVGNEKGQINISTMGAPVISIGVPTVIDSRAFSGSDEAEAMLVAPREVDEITSAGAKIIGDAINQAFGIF